MNIAFIAANVVIYFISHQAAHGQEAQTMATAYLAPGWDKFMLWPTNPHLYQFITYQFLHENGGHIFFNMLFLYVFGNNLEEKLGPLGYLAFYLAGGVLAGCGQMLTSGLPTLGASGAISAVTGMFLVLLPRTNIRMFIWIFIYVDVWEIPSLYFILFSVGKDLLESLYWAGNGAGTAYAAHLSGNVAGFAIGLFLLLARLVQRDHYDLLAVFHRWRRRMAYESIVATGYDPFGRSGGRMQMGGERGGGGTQDVEKPKNPRIEGLRMEIGELVHRHALSSAAEKYLELRKLDPQAILSMDDQLDIANELMTEQRYPEAAGAYEDFLRLYPSSSQHEQIMLVLALIYVEHLPRRERAIELFQSAIARLHDEKQRAFARTELERLEASCPSAPGPASGSPRNR